jgi:hypothetical protein
VLLLVFIHIQADRSAVHFGGQGGVGVARKAALVHELLLGVSGTSPEKQAQDKRLSEESSGGVHAYEMILLESELAVTGITTLKIRQKPLFCTDLPIASSHRLPCASASKTKWATISVTHFDRSLCRMIRTA